MKTQLLCFLFCLVCTFVWASQPSNRTYTATKITGSPPVIDGKLNDEAWNQGTWSGEFTQYDPYNDREPSFQTGFMVLYDDNNLYVAMRMHDDAPDSIVSRLARRDLNDGDYVAIGFDSYHDLRTAFIFGVNAAGVKFDYIKSNNGHNKDWSWDPNWWVSTSVDSLGWVAEMRIPFSQLRFDSSNDGLWGLQLQRVIYRKGEMSLWAPLPANPSGTVHFFGTLHGLNGIEPRSIFDITPYAVTSAARYPAVSGNPFLNGSDHNYKFGMDAKIGLTNHLTLDMTINPDFGQVEADPSEVNLTAYETFLREKRPFFIEGRNITSFSIGIGDGDIGNDNLFYSRRIGRRPSGNLSMQNGAVVNVPSFTNILGAAKVTGKTQNGWSLAFIESVTAEEKAEMDINGNRSFHTVEPLTNFLVGRIQKDLTDGNTIIGGMVTSVHRNLGDDLNGQMHSAAYSGGVDMARYFKNKTWMLNVNMAMSHVQGSEEIMLRTQRSPARYFQRPDAAHISIDSTRTSLTGTGGKIEFAKIGGGHWNIYSVVMWKSPEFEINDIGYMRQADQAFQVIAVNYRQWEPRGIYRSFNLGMNQYTMWNFAGENLMTGWNINGFIRYKNYWSSNLGIELNQNVTSTTLLRGGPAFILPNAINSWFGAATDNRKKLVVGINGNIGRSSENYMQRNRIAAGITYRPTNYVNMSLSPSYMQYTNILQFVRSYTDQQRYLLGTLKQEVVSFSFRLNLTIIPDLSLQYWGQPFVAVGNYSDFKFVADPLAGKFNDRYNQLTADQIDFVDGIYQIDENMDGMIEYQFGKPDFRVKEFLSNLVIRWEYQPGSSIHLVWSQNRSGFDVNGGLKYMRDLDELFSVKPHNTFLLKFTYRIGVR